MQRLIPACEYQNEIIIQNSRFIGTLSPAFTLEEAKAFILRIKREFPDASHNVPAYIIGHGNSVIAHCNDDGEPFGTAGKPILSVIQGSGFGDIAVVVTRYFGGTKLGKGGLARAYSDAAKSVVDIVPRALKISTYIVMIGISYPLYDSVHAGIKVFDGEIIEEVFAGEVTISAKIPVDRMIACTTYLRDLTHGDPNIVIIDEGESILPLSQVNSGSEDA